MPFTELQIRKLESGDRRYDKTETGVLPNDRGLQIRVYPSGIKTWLFRYTTAGKTERIRLGNFPEMGLKDAREAHHKIRSNLLQDLNPKQERVEKKREGLTVQALYDDFRDNHLRIARKCPEQAELALTKHVLPAWKNYRASDIERFEIVELIRTINKTSPRMAEVVKALISQMFKHGTDVGLIKASPAVGLPTIGSRGGKRERLLTPTEIKKFWKLLDTAKIHPHMVTAYKLLLITGQRRGEVSAAEWAHIDLTAASWTIPADVSKNEKEHQVPLSSMALELIGGLPTDSQWLLPSPTKPTHIDAHSLTRGIRNNEKHFEIEHFTPHDLRRTAASHMTALGIPRLHVTKVLNHSDQGITAVYDRHDYMVEKRQALDTWADYLRGIISGKAVKVTPLRMAS